MKKFELCEGSKIGSYCNWWYSGNWRGGSVRHSYGV